MSVMLPLGLGFGTFQTTGGACARRLKSVMLHGTFGTAELSHHHRRYGVDSRVP